MAGFKTHITVSTALGVGYGAVGHLHYGIPLNSCLLASGLCSLAGMLPDLDSDSGVPIRETMSFAAAIAPMLLLDRFARMNWDHESIVLAGGVAYLLVRFGLSGLLKSYTVHRGMWHSVPAALIAGVLAFLLCSCEDAFARSFKTGAVVLGYLSHLALDELYSFQIRPGHVRIKQSLGSAFKLWSRDSWANIATYALLAMMVALANQDPLARQHFAELRQALVSHVKSDSQSPVPTTLPTESTPPRI